MTTETAISELIPGLVSIYGDLIDSIILYGSVARGTATNESDVDIAILLNSISTKEMNDKMLDLIVDLELECNRVLSVIKIDSKRFNEWSNILPFYKNIQKDGVVLWKAA